ncbi:MAG: peptide deformylase [Steroidobacteraceae bacterium]
MARLSILEYPDPRLRTKALPVSRFDADLKRRIADMFETMYAALGIGLAATQVDWHQRLVVIDVSEKKNEPQVFINPEILGQTGSVSGEEGCLSVPGIYDDVPRAERIQLRSQDADGKVLTRELDGMLAVCVQHEMDHLEGKLFVDYLSELKRQRIRKKLDKERRERDSSARSTTARQGRT